LFLVMLRSNRQTNRQKTDGLETDSKILPTPINKVGVGNKMYNIKYKLNLYLLAR